MTLLLQDSIQFIIKVNTLNNHNSHPSNFKITIFNQGPKSLKTCISKVKIMNQRKVLKFRNLKSKKKGSFRRNKK
jgi:hypothetical protein